ncbi:hypothetical protein IV203_013623 [Nitzschia inconspicua]|uniref:Uncharacterized protein n=1 Tax=Nitzschia inconspicua TaxID=303405 RepID=A0A9K3M5G7_9STRA|nr:hypothetical protein IV203_013623 [Nitzschia inconspicua]
MKTFTISSPGLNHVWMCSKQQSGNAPGRHRSGWQHLILGQWSNGPNIEPCFSSSSSAAATWMLNPEIMDSHDSASSFDYYYGNTPTRKQETLPNMEKIRKQETDYAKKRSYGKLVLYSLKPKCSLQA